MVKVPCGKGSVIIGVPQDLNLQAEARGNLKKYALFPNLKGTQRGPRFWQKGDPRGPFLT